METRVEITMGREDKKSMLHSLMSKWGIKLPVDVSAIFVSAASYYGCCSIFYFPCCGKLD